MSDPLRALGEKIRSGERLSREEGVDLFRTRDLHELGRLADLVRERRNGNRVTYVRNMHLNYSNICTFECAFCGYSRKAGQEGAWQMRLEEIFSRAEQAHAERLDELHIVGGIHPGLPWDYYPGILRGLRERFPAVHLKAFTATEIDHFTRLSGKPLKEVLAELREAGLGSIPGGGAEVFSNRVWDQACGTKTRPERWLEIHRTWHLMGGRSTATMLYGHIETVEERVDHLIRLRALQDETHGFTAFIPLCFQAGHNRLAHLPRPTARTDLLVHAVARLILDNFDHLRAYWPMTGLKMAQILLVWGADDLDGTILEERVVHMAGADSPPGVTEEELLGLIREAGREPIHRDTLYHVLKA